MTIFAQCAHPCTTARALEKRETWALLCFLGVRVFAYTLQASLYFGSSSDSEATTAACQSCWLCVSERMHIPKEDMVK